MVTDRGPSPPKERGLERRGREKILSPTTGKSTPRTLFIYDTVHEEYHDRVPLTRLFVIAAKVHVKIGRSTLLTHLTQTEDHWSLCVRCRRVP